MPSLDEQIIEAQRNFLQRLDEPSTVRFITLLQRNGMTEEKAIAYANKLLDPLRLMGMIRQMDHIVAEVENKNRVLETEHFQVLDFNGKIEVRPRRMNWFGPSTFDRPTSEFITDQLAQINHMLKPYIYGLRDLTTRSLVGDALENLRAAWVHQRSLVDE